MLLAPERRRITGRGGADRVDLARVDKRMGRRQIATPLQCQHSGGRGYEARDRVGEPVECWQIEDVPLVTAPDDRDLDLEVLDGHGGGIEDLPFDVIEVIDDHRPELLGGRIAHQVARVLALSPEDADCRLGVVRSGEHCAIVLQGAGHVHLRGSQVLRVGKVAAFPTHFQCIQSIRREQ